MSAHFTSLTISTLSTAILVALFPSAHADTTLEDKYIHQSEQNVIQQNHERTRQTIEQDSTIQQTAEEAQQVVASETATPRGVGIDASWTTEQVYEQLERDPEAFENLLLRSIQTTNAAALRTLLPAYDRYPAKDPSVIDWGNAIIALHDGNTKKAVNLYRKLNAALPNVRLLRLQMASALYQNRQLKAAQSELEKLLREDMPDTERTIINTYLDALKRRDKWNVNANISFVRDNNLEDAPKVGTTIGDQYSSLSYNSPHEKGTGVSYGVSADKRWSYDNRTFSTFSTGVGGTYYWDNKDFNDIYTHASAGMGLQSATGEIEIAPTLSHSWYGGGKSTKGDKLEPYTFTKGIRLSASQWLSPKWLYQHNSSATNLTYKSPFEHNDGDIYSMSNGVLYAPNARQYYGVHWQLSKKDGVRESDSYERTGINLSWNNTWGKGYTTLATLGMHSKKYDGPNFANIVRHNKEYNVGLSLWKRDFSILGLTPRLQLSAKRVNSNYAFDDISEKNATIMFTKTF